jgi:putative SOS response-associated peptidase YedK
MLVILRPGQYDEWLTCAAEDAPDFFTCYPADRLVAQPSQKPVTKPTQATLPDL